MLGSDNLPGSDGTYCECVELCYKNAACQAFTYGDGSINTFNCYLHGRNLGEVVVGTDFTSGNYHCYEGGNPNCLKVIWKPEYFQNGLKITPGRLSLGFVQNGFSLSYDRAKFEEIFISGHCLFVLKDFVNNHD